tara:strand:- start:35482 stop:35895 length:414 start_codon:yes stop_codon:yes gene_type:complete
VSIPVLIVYISITVLVLWPSYVYAQSPDKEMLEEKAQKIDQMLMCPVCPAESIDQVQVEVAKQMRLKVRDMLGEGYTEEEILTYFEQRYGSNILAAPPIRGTMVLAWVIPLVIVGVMILSGVWVLYNMVYRKSGSEG